MYSASTLSGTESSSFWTYWDKVKNQLSQIVDVGPRINDLWNRAKNVHDTTKDPAVRKQTAEQLFRLSDMYNTWKEVKAYIDQYRGRWVQISSIAGSDTTPNLGIIPLVLPAWALASLVAGGLAALTYVATHGLNLIKQYAAEKSILNRVEAGTLTESGAQGLIEMLQPKPGSDPFSALTGNIGTMVPIVAGIGLLVMFGPALLANVTARR